MLFLVGLLMLISVGHPQQDVPGPVENVDRNKMLGRFYHFYTDEFSMNSSFKYYYCPTMDFCEVNETTLAFNKSHRMEGVHGDFVYYDGIAVQNDSKVDGKLDATYNAFPDITVQVWIVKLGPPNYGEERLYSYLITSSMNLKSWFVLVRDIGEFQDIHDTGVKEWLKDKNFSDPFTVNQPRECVYPEVMEEP